jgi:hypothetical protein
MKMWKRIRALDPRQPGGLVLLATTALLVLPTIFALLAAGARGLFARVAPDTFYYLVVGRNAGIHGSVSFDGEHWSNGFHPLWQAIVGVLYALRLPGTGTHIDLAYLIAMGFLLLVAAVWCLADLFRRPDGSLPSLFVLLPVGAYGLIVCGAWLAIPVATMAAENPWEGPEPLYGTLWRSANGMESAAVIAVYCWIVRAFVLGEWERSRRRAAKLGGMLALLGLARLDHFAFSFVLFGFLAWRGVRARSTRAGFVPEPATPGTAAIPPSERAMALPVVAMAGIFIGIVLAYVILNKVLFGSAMPISGRMKSSWPLPITDNAQIFISFYSWLIGNKRLAAPMIWRVLQAGVPFVAALISPLVLLRIFEREDRTWAIAWAGRQPRLSQALGATAIGIVILHAYNFLFVHPVSQGNWYYPVSILFVSLLGLQLAERVRDHVLSQPPTALGTNTGLRRALTPRAAVSAALCGVFLAVGIWFNLRFDHPAGYHARYSAFYFEDAPVVKRLFANSPPKLLELDDGIVSYATGFQAMSATGFGLDGAAAVEMQKGQLLDLALSRGFDHITTLVYMNMGALSANANPEQVRAFISRVGGNSGISAAARFPLSVAYRSPKTSFGIVKIAKP